MIDEGAISAPAASLSGRPAPSRPTLETEFALHSAGHRLIAGTDEVGRGPLAGPVVAAAVVLPLDEFLGRHQLTSELRAGWLAPVNDSKLLTPRQREQLYEQITSEAIAWAVAAISPSQIDRLGIARASTLAMAEAIRQLSIVPSFILTDAFPIPGLTIPQQPLIHGDRLSLSIAAASIVAKVTRDRMLVELDQVHPGYGFAQHKGYPTPQHLDALARLGPCPAHRRCFAPVRAHLEVGDAD